MFLQLTFPVRVVASLGVEVLVATNACGSINPAYNAGDFVIVRDHINIPGLGGLNPLVGLCDDRHVTSFFLELRVFFCLLLSNILPPPYPPLGLI